jgi:hypothetical protein
MSITKIEMEGIYNPPAPETRVLLLLKVHYNDQVYDWQIFAPLETSDWAEFLEENKTKIQNQIDAKESEWQALDPKTKTIDDGFGESVVIPIDKAEIVRADIPDYYAKRRVEYPPIGDQLDALWKGVDSPEFADVMNKIQEVKHKYPKV